MTVIDAPDAPATQQLRAARLAAFALGAGVAFDIGLRGGVANAVVAAGIAVVIVGLLADDVVRRAEARRLAVAAAVPALFLVVRTSPWLAASNLGAIAVLLAAAAAHARSGSLLDTTPARLARRLAVVSKQSMRGMAVLCPLISTPRNGTRDRIVRVARAGFVALPPLGLVVALLASGDAVFAGLLTPDANPGPLLGHLMLIAVLGLGALCVIVSATAEPEDSNEAPGAFGVVEATTMLGLAAAVLALFVLSQLVATTSAGRQLVQSAGLTPAEYARSGFFQLCWATAVIVAFIGLVRFLAAPAVMQRPVVRALAGAVPMLALGLVAVSLRRMSLYDDAFGLTMLRVWVVGAAAWMGALLVMVALRNMGMGGDRNWVVGGASAVALALVLVADLANPEAVVVRHNVERAREGAELDVVYLSELSDDAVPAIADAGLVDALRCGADRTGVAALNVGAARAADARSVPCARR